MAKLREEALALQAEHRAAVQWDLYNRTLSPDVFSVHKSKSWSAQKWHDHAIKGDNRGVQRAVAVVELPRAVLRQARRRYAARDPAHIALVALGAADPGRPSSRASWKSACPEQLKMDHRSVAFSVPGVPPGGKDVKQLTSVQNSGWRASRTSRWAAT
jgi:hypothetical protein